MRYLIAYDICDPKRLQRVALLSLGYTLLSSRVQAQCEVAGLETHLGALHEERAGRPSLVCDLVEPLRVPAVDRWVLRTCNDARLSADDFLQAPQKGVRLQKSAFSRTLAAWENHWQKHGRGPLDLVLERFIHTIRQSGRAFAHSRSGEAVSEGQASDYGEF